MSKSLVGVVSFGNLPFLKLFLRSVQETLTAPNTDVLVIVAKPGDEEMKSFLQDQNIKFIAHEKNMGFPASCNDLYEAAFTYGDYDNLIFCGNDIVVMPGALDAMIRTADETHYEMVCGSEFNSQTLCSLYPEAQQYFHGPNLIFTDFDARPWELHKEVQVGIQPDCRKDIRNCTLFKRSSFDKVGYEDVAYWPNGYFSDNSYFRRCDLAGVTACGLREGLFFHFWSRTIHQGENRAHSVYFQRNEEYYVRKWGGLPMQEKYKKPFNGFRYRMCDGVLLGDLRINTRENEHRIVDHLASL